MKSFQLFRRTLPSLQRTITAARYSQGSRISPLLNNILNTARRRPFQRSFHYRRPYSTSPNKPPYNPTPHLNSPIPSLSLSQRLRKLSREYGWSAFGVYLLLTALDFPFCFAAVRYLGTDRIGHYEHVLVEWVKSVIPEAVKEKWREARGKINSTGEEVQEAEVGTHGVPVEGTVGVVTGYDHGVKEAEQMSRSENASIWTQLALAYAIHKSFIFIRVPLTVAVTPKVVKVLRGWGWDIGKRRPKASKST